MDWMIKKFDELSSVEIYNILKLRNEVFIVEQQCPYLDCDGNDRKAYHLFAEHNGEIAAYLRILEKGIGFDAVAIGRVLVNKNHRSQGLAREIMLEAINFIRQSLNEGEIKLSAQVYLVDFYRSLGFREISEEYLEDDIPHIDMALNG